MPIQIPYVIKPSPIHGLGLFAQEDVKQGECVWRFDPLIDITFTNSQWGALIKALPSCSAMHLSRWGSSEDGLWMLHLDGFHFINHHSQANISSRGYNCISLRNIAKDEALLMDYSEFDEPLMFHP